MSPDLRGGQTGLRCDDYRGPFEPDPVNTGGGIGDQITPYVALYSMYIWSSL